MWGDPAHCMGILQSFHRAFKLGIKNLLSLNDRTKKCPCKYLAALTQLILSDSKKQKSKTWWSSNVVETFFPLHLDNTMEFSVRDQNTVWLTQKAALHKSTFEMDQHNKETKIAKSRAAEEE
jgi:hypothetical protein